VRYTATSIGRAISFRVLSGLPCQRSSAVGRRRRREKVAIFMDERKFWSIIEESRKALSPDSKDGNYARQERALERLVASLKPSDIAEFGDLLDQKVKAAKGEALYGVAHELGEGCGDDGFVYFRRWLVSMGEDVYRRALADPHSVRGAAQRPEVEDVFFEEFGRLVRQRAEGDSPFKRG